MNAIEVKNFSKKFKKFFAASNVSFSVPKGSVFGLVGLNGAGKTTTIKSITGLLKNFEGEILIEGNPWGSKTYNQLFSFLPELFLPPRYLKGIEYIRFMQNLYNVDVNIEQVEYLCHMLNFDKKLLNEKTVTYSKGTVQKIGLIQTVCAPCNVLILDEPMSGLDPLARSRLKEVILGENAKGRTLFLSTHILHDIDTLCSHIALIHEGKLLFTGSPNQLKSKQSTDNLEDAFIKEIKQ